MAGLVGSEMSIEANYKFTCDNCGKVENKETSSLPKDWSIVKLETESGVYFWSRIYICDGCGWKAEKREVTTTSLWKKWKSRKEQEK